MERATQKKGRAVVTGPKTPLGKGKGGGKENHVVNSGEIVQAERKKKSAKKFWVSSGETSHIAG